jgi:hypothetical protein
MLHHTSCRVVVPIALTGLLFFLPASGHSQDQQTPSVAEAARRAREQKKKAEKPARIISDDTLKPAPPGASEPVTPAAAPPMSPELVPQSQAVTVTAAPAEAATSAAPATPAADATPNEKKESASDSAEATSMKTQLEELEKELDLLRREVPLERDNYYSKPGYERDTTGKSKLDALVQQLTGKQQDVDALKTRLTALLEQLAREKAAAPESNEKAATPPQM